MCPICKIPECDLKDTWLLFLQVRKKKELFLKSVTQHEFISLLQNNEILIVQLRQVCYWKPQKVHCQKHVVILSKCFLGVNTAVELSKLIY